MPTAAARSLEQMQMSRRYQGGQPSGLSSTAKSSSGGKSIATLVEQIVIIPPQRRTLHA